MDIENKEYIADLVKLLRFQAKNYESAAADVIEHLLAYKEAAESQKPVQWVCELSSNPWPNGGGTRRDTKEEAIEFINSESNYCKYDIVSPLYRLPCLSDNESAAARDAKILFNHLNCILVNMRKNEREEVCSSIRWDAKKYNEGYEKCISDARKFTVDPSTAKTIAQSVPLTTVMDLRAYMDEFGKDADLNVIRSELGEMIRRANGAYESRQIHDKNTQDKPKA